MSDVLKAHDLAFPMPPAERMRPAEVKPETRWAELAPAEFEQFRQWKAGTFEPLAAELRELRRSIGHLPQWFANMAAVIE